MRRLIASLFILYLAASSGIPAQAGGASPGDGSSKDLWHELSAIPTARGGVDSRTEVHPERFDALTLDKAGMASTLAAAPLEFTRAARTARLVLSLPTPTGDFARFAVQESPVMAPELAARYPQIKTYDGQGIDDPWATIRFDLGLTGFHAQVLSPHGAWYIDPNYHLDESVYVSYFGRDLQAPSDAFVESEIRGLVAPVASAQARTTGTQLRTTGTELRTYRLALAADVEYSAFHGVTVAAVLSAMVTAVNRVTGIYQTELAIRLQLVANDDSLIYLTEPDPYSNTNPDALLDENQANIDTVIGSANYDIGHVFTTGGGGLAGLAVVGVDGFKAQGETGSPSPTGDAFYVDYVAHEMGHQFGGNHTFNGVKGSCSGNANSATAMEPGSGSSIQAYAGICGADDLQLHSDPYFHAVSFDEIVAYTTTPLSPGNLGAAATINHSPTVAVTGGPFTIPKRTPFALSATGSDADGDPLTFAWEQYDGGVLRALDNQSKATGARFRSFSPTTDSTRVFPNMASILSNATNENSGSCPALPAGLACLAELLPKAARAVHFRVTVRDNRVDGGGVNSANTTITVAAAGPFLVTAPNTALTLPGGSATTVTWNVAGTNAAPINTANVNILLSTDGGNTFPTVLAATTPNDGAQLVAIPNTPTGQARLKIEAVGNVYFDVSDANFTIGAGAGAANDNFANATVLTGSSVSISGDTNIGATRESGEPNHGGNVGGASVWYSWTAPATSSVTIDTSASNLNTLLGVYTGSAVNALTEIASNDDCCSGFQSQVTFTATSGTPYMIAVDGFNGGGGALLDTINLHVAQTAPLSAFVPDGRIRKGTGAYVGDNVYNTTAIGQSKTGAKPPGKTISFGILVQNDAATNADSFNLTVSGTASAMYTVTYWRGTTNITAAVVAGTYATPSLAPGATYLITAKVRVNSSATVGSSTTRLVTITSVGDGTKQDAVSFTGRRF